MSRPLAEQERLDQHGADGAREAADTVALEAAVQRAEQSEAVLRDALDSMSEGFVIYDRDGRIVMCNENFLEVYGRTHETMAPGDQFEDIIRAGLARGDYADAIGREEEWLRERLASFRSRYGTYERHLSNGRWLLVTDRPMRNGGTVSLRIDITSLKEAQAALRESESRLERAQTIAGIGSWELDISRKKFTWSKEMYRIHGLSPDAIELTMDNLEALVHRSDRVSARRWLANFIAGRSQASHEFRIVTPDGKERIVLVEGRAIPDGDGIIRRLSGTLQDITERRLIERQLAHSQKMEAIGNLSGGLSHDINNMLAVINVNVELLKQRFGRQPEALELCNEALGAARRGADLVKRLLAFARRQPLHPVKTDVNTLIEDIGRLLGRTLGERIDLTFDLGAEVMPVQVDPAQLDATLVNLATNARDAMPDGGQLHIATRNVHITESHAVLYPDVTPGRYVLIEVSDTGTGIPQEIIGRIYEPFFTTKGPEKGTGLGLSMVFGFVKQSGGHLSVYSEVGHGTTFRIYLPYNIFPEEASPAESSAPVVMGRNETVLLVEDNVELRRAVARQLQSLGYVVREADSADAALDIISGDEPVDLLFTDVIMPGRMDGYDLASRAVQLRPGLHVLISSGFAGPRRQVPLDAAQTPRLLPKPYAREDLARALREVLDSGA